MADADIVSRLLFKAREWSQEFNAAMSQTEARAQSTGKQIAKGLGEGAGDSLRNISAQVPVVGNALSGLSGSAGVAAAGLGLVALAAARGVAGIEEAERAARQLDAVLKTTGNTTGFTKQELLDYSDALELGLGRTAEEIQGAQTALAQFSAVSGSVFERATNLSADLAVVMGTDMATAATTLGTVLQNLAQGNTEGLNRAFKSLGTEQLNQIETLARQGRGFEAIMLLFEKAERQIGDRAEENGRGLTPAWFRLTTQIDKATEAFAENARIHDGLVFGIDATAASVGRLTARIQELNGQDLSGEGLAFLLNPSAAVARLGSQRDVGLIEGPGATPPPEIRDPSVRQQRIINNGAFGADFVDGIIAKNAVAIAQEEAVARAVKAVGTELDDQLTKLERRAKLGERQAEVEEAVAKVRSRLTGASEAEIKAAEAKAEQAVRQKHALEDQTRAQQKATQAAEQASKAEASREQALTASVEQLELAAELAGYSRDEQEILLAIEQRQVAVQRELTDAEKERIRNAIVLKREQDAIRKGMEDALAAMGRLPAEMAKKAAEEAVRAHERATAEMERQQQEQFRSLSDALYDGFLEKGTSFWNIFKSTGMRVLADLAAASLLGQQPQGLASGQAGGLIGAIGRVFGLGGNVGGNSGVKLPNVLFPGGGIGGGMSGTEVSGKGGVEDIVASIDARRNAEFSAMSSQPAWMRNFQRGFKDMFSDVGKVGKDLFKKVGINFDEVGGKLNSIAGAAGQAFAGAGIGASVSGIAGMFGLKQSNTGAMIGGALGSFMGPLGSAIGGLLGGTIGGMLKKTPKATSTITTDTLGEVEAGEGKGSKKLRDAAEALGNSVASSLERIAQAIDADIVGGLNLGSIGQRGKKFTFDPTGQGRTKGSGVQKFKTEEEAIQAALKYAITTQGVFDSISETSQRVLRGAQDVEKALNVVAAIESIPKRLKQIEDPTGYALDELNEEFEKLRDTLNGAGASAKEMADLEKLYGLERARVIEQTGKQSIEALKGLKDDLTLSSASGLSLRDQRSAIEATFAAFEKDILAGKSIDQGAFADAGRKLLDIERQLSGSTSAFYEQRDRVLGLTDKAIASVNNATSITAANPFAKETADAATATARATAEANELLRTLPDRIAAAIGGGGGGGFIGEFGRNFVRAV